MLNGYIYLEFHDLVNFYYLTGLNWSQQEQIQAVGQEQAVALFGPTGTSSVVVVTTGMSMMYGRSICWL